MENASAIVSNAIKATNDTRAGFLHFRGFKQEAETELSGLLGDINKCGHTLKDGAAVSKRCTESRAERDRIDACLLKCLSTLKAAYDTISKSARDAMA